MFFEGIRSERQLIETASLNLAHRWYLGYALDEELPDHSSLTRIRQRLGVDVFQRFFEQIVDLCQEAGLVWGRELYFDATKVEANAGSRRSSPASTTKPQPTWPTVRGRTVPGRVHRTPIPSLASQGSCRCRSTRAVPPPAIHRGGCWRSGGSTRSALPRRLPAHQRLPGQPHRSRCLPDVGLGRDPPRLPRPLRRRRREAPHHPGRPGDAGRRHGEPGHAGPAVAGLLPAEDLAAPGDRRCQVRHHREHRGHRGRRHPRLLSPDRLRAPDRLLRPGRVHLRSRARRVPLPAGASPAPLFDEAHRGRGGLPWRGAICNACPVKAKCTTSDHGRKVQRSFYIDYLEKVRGYHATEAYKKAIRKRQVWVEPLFAEAKEWHGLRRLRLRGLHERQHPGAADRGRTEPEALAGRNRVGAASCPLWEPPGPSGGARAALGRLRVITDLTGDLGTRSWIWSSQ